MCDLTNDDMREVPIGKYILTSNMKVHVPATYITDKSIQFICPFCEIEHIHGFPESMETGHYQFVLPNCGVNRPKAMIGFCIHITDNT